jgi:hypothetical protein
MEAFASERVFERTAVGTSGGANPSLGFKALRSSDRLDVTSPSSERES